MARSNDLNLPLLFPFMEGLKLLLQIANLPSPFQDNFPTLFCAETLTPALALMKCNFALIFFFYHFDPFHFTSYPAVRKVIAPKNR